jgi:hypothetical protein
MLHGGASGAWFIGVAAVSAFDKFDTRRRPSALAPQLTSSRFFFITDLLLAVVW